jgi:DeoR family transcriptional regulator, ulaG and ulaABCDEF operon transcriptional repressor
VYTIKMLEAERQKLILKIVQERSIVSISDLVEMLEASDATLRRDVNALAERGELRRIRGGAEAIRPRHEAHLVGRPFALSSGIHVPQKRAIARAAAALIQDGDSIIISGGTTTFGLTEFLRDRVLDVLTNSIAIVTELLATSRNRVTIPGGTVFREQNIILSPFENDTMHNFRAEKMFMGCFGIDRFGLMEADPLIAQSQARLLQRTERIIVMADSSKFQQRSSMIVTGLEKVSTLITDDSATDEQLALFREANIDVIKAKVEPEDEQQQLA